MQLKRAFGVATVLVLLTACGAETDTANAPGAQTTVTQGSGDAGDAVPAELAFTATTVAGESFDGATLFGKPAVLWFWAPWCIKCQGEAAGIADAAEQSDATFVGVAANDTVDAMRGFIDERGVDGFTHLADENADIWRHFGVAAQPAYAFISSAGEVEVVTQQLGHDELLAKVAALA